MAGTKTLIMSIKDRLMVPSFFPQKSNILNQMLCQEIGELIKIGPQEREEIGMKVDGVNIIWDEGMDVPKPFEFTESQISFLKDQITRLDQENQISQEHLNIIKKIKAL